MAAAGSETSFEQGREQLKLLAGLQLTAKSVERQAEAIGADFEAGEQQEIRRAKQLELPAVCAPAVPILYIEMDGPGAPVVNKEREGRAGKAAGQPARTREVKLGCVFTQTKTDPKGRPIRDPDSTSYVAAIEPAEEFGPRLYTEAWRRGWSQARKKVVLGDGAVWTGTWPISTSPAPSRSWTSITPASTSGNSPLSSSPTTSPGANNGRFRVCNNSTKEKSRRSPEACASCARTTTNLLSNSPTTPSTLSATPNACAARGSVHRGCLWAPAWWRRAAGPSLASG